MPSKYLSVLVVIALMTGTLSVQVDEDSLVAAWKHCAGKLETRIAIEEILHTPNTPTAQCHIECYLKQLKVIDNNRLDSEGVQSVLTIWFKNAEKSRIISEKCTAIPVPETPDCTGMHEALTCYMNGGRKVDIFAGEVEKALVDKLIK